MLCSVYEHSFRRFCTLQYELNHTITYPILLVGTAATGTSATSARRAGARTAAAGTSHRRDDMGWNGRRQGVRV